MPGRICLLPDHPRRAERRRLADLAEPNGEGFNPVAAGREVKQPVLRQVDENSLPRRIGQDVQGGYDQPATAGWAGNQLYLQVYPSKTQTEEIDTARLVSLEPARGARSVVRAAAGRYADVVDWRAVDKAAQERTGAPVLVADRLVSAPRLNEAQKPEGKHQSAGL